MIISVLARLLGAAATIYMILCSVRIFLSWAPDIDQGRFSPLLGAIVDPYLRYFSRFPGLKTGRFDFSPIVALSVLSVANNLFATVAYTGRISAGIVLGLVINAAWSALSFLLSFVSAGILIRIIIFFARWNSLHPISLILDAMLNPVLHRINALIYRGKIIDYLQGLLTGFIVLVVLRAAGGAFIGLLVRLAQAIPF
jgi:uncharacterized protein YggT (Ycf19 family)